MGRPGNQQSLLVQTNKPGPVAYTIPTTQPSAPADPIKDAAATGANVAVFGTFQIVNGEIRCTGQVVDTSNYRVLGGLSGTAAKLRELFQLEDSLGSQLHGALAQLPGYETADADQASQMYQPGYSTIHYASPMANYSTPEFYSGDSYAAFGSPYYYSPFYSGLFFGTGRGFFPRSSIWQQSVRSPFWGQSFRSSRRPIRSRNFFQSRRIFQWNFGHAAIDPRRNGRPFVGAGGRTFGGFNNNPSFTNRGTFGGGGHR